MIITIIIAIMNSIAYMIRGELIFPFFDIVWFLLIEIIIECFGLWIISTILNG